MAAGGERKALDISKLRTLSEVSKLGARNLKLVACQLNFFSPDIGKRALVNVVCRELRISTCGKKMSSSQTRSKEQKS